MATRPSRRNHPYAGLLRKNRRYTFPNYTSRLESEVKAVCNALADAHDPITLNTKCTPRDRWLAYPKPLEDNRIMSSVVRGMLSIHSQRRTLHRLMDRLTRFGNSASGDDDARKARVNHPSREWDLVDWQRMLAWSEDRMLEAINLVGQAKKAPWV